ncbi:MAG: hypothetical protein D3926_24910 [Desulfobacteraceae bacterium]|nr:MAG: hypothetical protein D3926_24910 [Desulfobacteraceae bacterium]
MAFPGKKDLCQVQALQGEVVRQDLSKTAFGLKAPVGQEFTHMLALAQFALVDAFSKIRYRCSVRKPLFSITQGR